MKMLPRIIPCLLLRNQGFVKTQQFKNPVYLGDPLNILKIFNEKEVDEVVVLDITATVQNSEPQEHFLTEMASECVMPMGYGGGIKTVQQAEAIFRCGYEKVVLNTAAFENPALITEITRFFGSQSVVVSIDVRRSFFGKNEVYVRSGTKGTGMIPEEFAKQAEDRGAGEILINSIDRDGTMKGYDLELIQKIARAVSVPVIACGGAGNVLDLHSAIETGGASAAAAGSMFVFQGKHRAVLINVPSQQDLREVFK